MIYEITTYRDNLIQYDDAISTFIVEINGNSVTDYVTLSDAKKAIDEFLKFNTNFVPFKALKKLYFGYNDVHEIQVVGVLDNGTLVYKTESEIINFLEVGQQHLLYNYDIDFLTNCTNLRNEYDMRQTKFYADRNELISSLVQMDSSKLPK